MPHKHTRRKGGDESKFNLAPTKLAKPLPAFTNPSKTQKKQQKQTSASHGHRNEEDKSYKHDDTPRAFSRLLQLQTSKKRPHSALDDGNTSRAAAKKKRKVQQEQPEITPASDSTKADHPQILPGERLRDFAARVDHALPVAGLQRKDRVRVDGIPERQTRKEKKMQKMYASWREEDARYKEKLAELAELEEEEREEQEAQFGAQSLHFSSDGGKKGRRKSKPGADDDDDPWAQLQAKREQRRGLHDVVQAPPSFKAVPRERFKVREGARVDVENVPAAAGSLKRREELGQARGEVIERYRGLMGRGG